MNILEFAIAKRMSGGNSGGGGQTDETSIVDAIIDGSVTEISSNAESVFTHAFYYRSKLISARFPFATTLGINAFANCTELTSVYFPVAKTLNDTVFIGCKKLNAIHFPLLKTINSKAFYQCTGLTHVVFPSVNLVSTYSFEGCTALISADFHSNVSFLNSAFKGCGALTALLLRNETMCTLRYSGSFTNTPIESGNGHIYVPSALVDTYKADSVWSTYANQFRALEDYTVDGTTTGALDETKI